MDNKENKDTSARRDETIKKLEGENNQKLFMIETTKIQISNLEHKLGVLENDIELNRMALKAIDDGLPITMDR